MQNKTVYLLLGLLFVSGSLFGQNKPGPDTLFVQSLKKELILKMVYTHKINSLKFEQKPSGKNLEYLPAPTKNIGLGFNYGKLGLVVSFALPAGQAEDALYGKTQMLDLGLKIFSPKMIFDLSYETMTGLYLASPRKHNLPPDFPFPQREDMHVRTGSFTGYYVFNHKKYSFRAPFVQNEIQRKSAGSFLAGFYSGLFHLKSDTAALPAENADILGSSAHLNRAYYLSGGVLAGYAHTFVFGKKKNFYTALAALPGFGWQRRSLKGTDFGEKNVDGLGGSAKSRLSFGFTGRQFFGNVNGTVFTQIFRTAEDDFSIRYSSGDVQFTLGWRFDVRGQKKTRS